MLQEPVGTVELHGAAFMGVYDQLRLLDVLHHVLSLIVVNITSPTPMTIRMGCRDFPIGDGRIRGKLGDRGGDLADHQPNRTGRIMTGARWRVLRRGAGFFGGLQWAEEQETEVLDRRLRIPGSP